ncbi:DNA primase [Micropruina sonneratiae]|uniref:DNA primase n=1 Tax=Micropruina sonneratiae TaxID=2986940 RepID=UPI0022279591|nr:DNA primase [Micropruina sp. KQZ13P-5]MCW3158504.1 DNA primase [Micropruina sp. KQZ13P-5]
MRTLTGVPGLINEEDLATVRERSRIEDVVGSYVTLRPGGGGALVGLCPFHDEKTPSFRVTPARGFYYCFGCNAGGDVIGFVQQINNCSFVEAVEFLADRVGVQLRYTEGGGPRVEPGLRSRILEANRLAADFFAGQLTKPDAVAGRQFLTERGFDRDAAEHFGVGFAPTGGRELAKHLRAHKFSDDELIKASLIREGGWDYFQGRLLWPIRDAGRSVLGFGARRIFDDDRMPAKYINTRETPVYKKSHVLYGLDLARQHIAKKNQVVVVEGYTDVMAAHLAGVDTAVASCGTAFGDDHARLLSRLIGSTDALKGEVIFTFDGDAAGQAAALKVFSGDQHFISQTYVAIEPSGLDPCDLRIQHGDAAVRELIGRREPLYRYVMANTIGGFDLDRVDGRLGALRAAAPLVGSVRDHSLVNGYIHELAKMLGTDVDEVRREVSRAGRRTLPAAQARHREPPAYDEPPPEDDEPQLLGLPMPNPRDRTLEVERGTLRLMVRAPEVFTDAWNGVAVEDFTHPTYAAVFGAILAAGAAQADWPQPVLARLDDASASSVVAALATEPLLRPASPAYAAEYVAKLRLLAVSRSIANLKSKLQRTNPVDDQVRYNRMFAGLLELEQQRRELNDIAAGPAL